MGCAGSSAAAAAAREPQSFQAKLLRGQVAIIRNCPNAALNGEQVICETYNGSLNEWVVKGGQLPAVGMHIAEKFLQGIEKEPLPQAETSNALTLLRRGHDTKQIGGENSNLLTTILEEEVQALADCCKEKTIYSVRDVHSHASRIIEKKLGVGASGECPFASEYEVQLYYRFCLRFFAAWADHRLNEDEDMDAEFFSQIRTLCEILCFLDPEAVPLADELVLNIKRAQREALFPNLVLGQELNGEDAIILSLSVGKKWELQGTKDFQKALTVLELERRVARRVNSGL